MTQSPPPPPEEDITSAVAAVQKSGGCPMRCVSGKIRQQIKAHPRLSMFWVMASFAIAVWVCKYFALCILLGLALWCTCRPAPTMLDADPEPDKS